MLFSNFKVGGFKVFGEPVTLNFVPKTKNVQYLSENIIERKDKNIIKKNLKSAIIYGGNNSGKSSLLHGLMTMKNIFKKGNVEDFPFDIYRNFSYEFDNIIRFEITFLVEFKTYIYGLEIKDKNTVGEYLFEEEDLLFSRELDGSHEGSLFNDKDFEMRFHDLPADKLVVPYFIEYTKVIDKYKSFSLISKFFSKLHFVDNRRNEINVKLYNSFIHDKKKMKILNRLISSTELYLERRDVMPEEEFYNSDLYKSFIEENNISEISNTDDKKDNIKELIDVIRVISVYKDKNGEFLNKPSFIFDSVGTNKFIVLAMHIINTLLNNDILLIDEFDSSLHHKLTRALVILMNSSINIDAQFILTSHDVKLLSPKLFRKDQINFILRDDYSVEVVSLDDFKANSKQDIRSNSNFEKMYIEERIVPRPNTDIYQVIKEFNLYVEKKTVN